MVAELWPMEASDTERRQVVASKPCDNEHVKRDFERRQIGTETKYICKYCGTTVRPLTYQIYANTRPGK